MLSVYATRGLDTQRGRRLPELATRAGFRVESADERARTVTGGSAEAAFHRTSFAQLAAGLGAEDAAIAEPLRDFLCTFGDPGLVYSTRTTVSLRALRP